MNATTISAIVAACWAHPSGVAYLEKIEQIRLCAEASGNPCCSVYSAGASLGAWPHKKKLSRAADDRETGVPDALPAEMVSRLRNEMLHGIAAAEVAERAAWLHKRRREDEALILMMI